MNKLKFRSYDDFGNPTSVTLTENGVEQVYYKLRHVKSVKAKYVMNEEGKLAPINNDNKYITINGDNYINY
tara:strand:- start:601 stop:813 length:213 start_codon:yes stop_codon:yes gene_type:complete